MRRSLFVGGVLLVAALSVLMGGTALANAPERHELSFEEAFTTSDFCSFPTQFEWVGTGYGIIFTDGDGDFVKQRDRIRETLTVTNLETGVSISGKDNYSITFNAVDGTFTRVGLWYHLNSPGSGVVLHDVGRVVFDSDGNLVFAAGQHQWLNGDIEGLCGALI